MAEPYVIDNLLVSTEFPAIQVKVAAPFYYLGKIEFTLKGIASGERFIFVDARDSKIERLFINQPRKIAEIQMTT